MWLQGTLKTCFWNRKILKFAHVRLTCSKLLTCPPTHTHPDWNLAVVHTHTSIDLDWTKENTRLNMKGCDRTTSSPVDTHLSQHVQTYVWNTRAAPVCVRCGVVSVFSHTGVWIFRPPELPKVVCFWPHYSSSASLFAGQPEVYL